jgi:hypothetical protein
MEMHTPRDEVQAKPSYQEQLLTIQEARAHKAQQQARAIETETAPLTSSDIIAPGTVSSQPAIVEMPEELTPLSWEEWDKVMQPLFRKGATNQQKSENSLNPTISISHESPFIAPETSQERLEAFKAMNSNARSDTEPLQFGSYNGFMTGMPKLHPTSSGTHLEVLSLESTVREPQQSVISTDSASPAPPGLMSDQLRIVNQDSFEKRLPVLSAPSSSGVDHEGSPSAQRSLFTSKPPELFDDVTMIQNSNIASSSSQLTSISPLSHLALQSPESPSPCANFPHMTSF